MNDFLPGKHILVVEDEMMILGMIEDILADLGCASVLSASSIDEALELIGRHPIDAAMLDVNLRGEDSYPIAEALDIQGVPFAFVTGYGHQGLRKDYRCHPTLSKPFHKHDFNKMLEFLLIGAGA